MQPRKKQKQKPTTLPKEFLRTVADLFNKQFKKERGQADFLVYGNIYMNEALLCVSLVNPKSLAAGTIYVSSDLPEGIADQPDKVTERLQVMVDIVSSWMGQIFSENKGDGLEIMLTAIRDQPDTWQDLTWEKQKFFVRLNRDNRVLEGAADRFLKEKGFDPESDEFLMEEGDLDDEDEDGGSTLH